MEPAVHSEIRVNGHLDGHSVGLVRRSPGQLRDRAEMTITGRVADQVTPHSPPAKAATGP
jgi:hypothetical protein